MKKALMEKLTKEEIAYVSKLDKVDDNLIVYVRLLSKLNIDHSVMESFLKIPEVTEFAVANMDGSIRSYNQQTEYAHDLTLLAQKYNFNEISDKINSLENNFIQVLNDVYTSLYDNFEWNGTDGNNLLDYIRGESYVK